MSDPFMFSAGGPFTTHCFLDSVRAAPENRGMKAVAVRTRLGALLPALSRGSKPNGTQTREMEQRLHLRALDARWGQHRHLEPTLARVHPLWAGQVDAVVAG